MSRYRIPGVVVLLSALLLPTAEFAEHNTSHEEFKQIDN